MGALCNILYAFSQCAYPCRTSGSMGEECIPTVAMVMVQVGYAGMHLVSKLAMDAGMSPFIMIAYRQVVSALFLAPVAFVVERKTRTKITRGVIFQIFLCSLFGATMNQLMYFTGLKYSTPTIACALANTVPAITFIMAVPFRMETVGIRTLAGQAKVIGTIICLGGSMLMTFYKGSLIKIVPSPIHWRYADSLTAAASSASAGDQKMVLGAILVVASCVSWSIWFIIQAKMSKNFSSPYTSSAIMCAMASVQCLLAGAAVERNVSAWVLGWDIRLAAVLYAGIIGSSFAISLMSWCIEKRGPLFVSMFSPLLLVIVALLGWAMLDEKIYVASVAGSFLVVGGLYMVLWGKGRELKIMSNRNTNAGRKDIEVEHEEGEGSLVFSLPLHDSHTNEAQDTKA